VRAPERSFHRGLDRPAVVGAALRLLDEHGRQALTMRRLAEALDVRAASLYSHVRDKDDLVDGVLDQVLDEVTWSSSGNWRADLVAGYSAYRRTLVAHPAAVPLLVERSSRSASQLRLVSTAVELLESSGLSTDDAVSTHVTLVAFTIGFVAQEVGRSPSLAPELVASFPVMGRTFEALQRTTVDERFRAGLDVILLGASARQSLGGSPRT
jgi:AcrR family transcriptional regulator